MRGEGTAWPSFESELRHYSLKFSGDSKKRLISDCVNVVLLTYNSITKTNFNAPTTVKPFSTYLNFKLDEQQVTFLNENIQARHSSS